MRPELGVVEPASKKVRRISKGITAQAGFMFKTIKMVASESPLECKKADEITADEREVASPIENLATQATKDNTVDETGKASVVTITDTSQSETVKQKDSAFT